jgi:hypothetical protein
MAFSPEVVQEEIENLKQTYPERKELINVYKAMLEVDSLGPRFDSYPQYLKAVGEGLSLLGVQKAIFIFQDLGLIHREGMIFRPIRSSKGDKVELDDSPHYRICQAERNCRYLYLKSLL